MQSENNGPSTEPTGGDIVLLYDIAPAIGTMLVHALRLAGYVPVEGPQPRELLRWLREPPTGLPPAAVVCDMAAPAEPELLRRLVDTPSLTVVAIADRPGSARAHTWAEWVPLQLPRSFRVRMLLDLLRRQHAGSPQGTAG